MTQYCNGYVQALDQLQLEGYPAHVVVEALLHPEERCGRCYCCAVLCVCLCFFFFV